MATHSPDQLRHEERRYLQVFAWLAVLTVLEIGVIYVPIPRFHIGLMLVVLAATKASLVALYYMHLAVEKRTLMYIALTPALLCLILLFALLPDLSAVTRTLVFGGPSAGEALQH
jgi:caa(3)-type oxidase subunit IV